MATLQLPTPARLTRTELQSLVEVETEPSLSIYMPTVRSGREFGQNPVRLRNLVRDAASRLHQWKRMNGAARALEAELSRLQEGDAAEELTREPSDGLALFIRDGMMRAVRAPLSFEERIFIGMRFYITPMLEYLQGNGRFFVLAVSQNDVRLLQGDKHSLAEVSVTDLPKNLMEALNIDEFMQSIQFHTGAPGGRLGIPHGGGMFHGQSGGDQGEKKDLVLEYFRRLDDALTAYLHDDEAPLVFAGVGYLFPLYQQCNHYRGLIEEPIAGNPERSGPSQLHGAAWNIVKARFDAARHQAVEQFGALAAHGKGSDYLPQVIDAAQTGRVGTLLLARGAKQLGSVNPETGVVKLASDGSAESEDLLDYAAFLTLASSGAVYLLEPSEMPTDSPAAALLRY